MDGSRARDRRSGEGEYLTDIDRRRHAPARATPAPCRRAAARCRWRGRSTRSTASSTRSCSCCWWWAPPGWRSARHSAPAWPHAALAPIARFTRRTEELAADPDPSQRMEVSGRDELARLARSFNATLDALEQSVEAQRQLVADASHELRTPIASLRANIQTLEHSERLPAHELEALRADIVSELDELTALVADIVELARGDQARRRGGRRAPRRDRAGGGVTRARARTRRGHVRARGRADGGARRARAHPARGGQPGGQRAQVEPGRGRRGDRPARRRADRARPRPGLRRRRPAARVRALLPRRRTRAAGPARAWGWRSCARPPRRTAATARRPTPRAGARSCGSRSGLP